MACLLLLDTSGSMDGAPIRELNSGLQALKESLEKDVLARKRAEIGIVTFGSPLRSPRTSRRSTRSRCRSCAASGTTAMSQAILNGLARLAERKAVYKSNGIQYYRPWVFLMTDGAPTDTGLWPQAVERVQTGEARKEFSFFAVGVGSADPR